MNLTLQARTADNTQFNSYLCSLLPKASLLLPDLGHHDAQQKSAAIPRTSEYAVHHSKIDHAHGKGFSRRWLKNSTGVDDTPYRIHSDQSSRRHSASREPQRQSPLGLTSFLQ